VDKLRDGLNAIGIQTPGKSSSIQYYGFFVEFKGWKYWLGYYLRQWRLSGTPIVLQIMCAPDGISLNAAESRLQQLSFYKDKDLGGKESWYWPVRFTAGDETIAQMLAAAVKSTVSSVADAFEPEQQAAARPNDLVVARLGDMLEEET
jgi:hypothetical protein